MLNLYLVIIKNKLLLGFFFRLGNYRMPFAWSARPLFRLYSCELDTSSDFMTLYRQELSKLGDDDMVKILMEYRK